MNLPRFILFCFLAGITISGWGQDVRTYLDRRTLAEGESLRVIVSCRGIPPIATPEFPELEHFRLGERIVRGIEQGAGRITVYEQTYIAESPGTEVIPAIRIPFREEVYSQIPGVVSVRKPNQAVLRGMIPHTLDATLFWVLDHTDRFSGQIQHGILYLEFPKSQQNYINWDLGNIAELADSLRRSAAGITLLKDSIFSLASTPPTREGDRLRFACYEAWWGCRGNGPQMLPSLPLRIQHLWRAKSQYRGAAAPVRAWQDEFLLAEPIEWMTESSPHSGLVNAESGPVVVSSSWQNSQLRTGEPFPLQVNVSGERYMNSVSAPDIRLPEGLVLRGPESQIFYEEKNGTLVGTKRLDYLVYPAEAGTYVLPNIRYTWMDPEKLVVDSTEVPLPVLTVTGSPIPQLLEQQKIEDFYLSRTQASDSLSTLSSFNAYRPIALLLLACSLGVLFLAIRTERKISRQKRITELRNKRFKHWGDS